MRPRQIFSVLLLLLASSLCTHAQEAKPAAADDSIQAADKLFHSGKTEEAATAYEALLKADAAQAHVRAMLIRTRLLQQKVDEANELAREGTAREDATAELFAALGDVHFRRAQMGEAETAYLRAKRMDPKQLRAYLGLARLYDAFSMHRHAYDLLNVAHDLAPGDMDVQRQWMNRLPRRERMQALENYLSVGHPEDAQKTRWMREYLAYLKATVDKPSHGCRQINKPEHTEIELLLLLRDANHLRGLGLPVKFNNHSSRLMLDTGASGIMIGRAAAKRAGLEELSRISFTGIGDHGPQNGYMAVVKHLQIGSLEFEDCVVEVSDRRNIVEDDGLIGANVFDSYLVEIDGPSRVVRLSPLPARPGDKATTSHLQTDESNAEEEAADTNSARHLPKDRYVAPEMAGWTKIFRFGHDLLIPTQLNDKLSTLFLLDTGSQSNIVSTRAAREVTKVHHDDMMRVKGISGEVEKVYSAYDVTLKFGHFSQKNEYMIALDMDSTSRYTGTEVSGTIGFTSLRILNMKIDYRDGLVDFVYDPKKVKLHIP